MRIGIVIERLGPGRGGAEQWTRQLVDWLARRGHEIHLLDREIAGADFAGQVVSHSLGSRLSRLGFAQEVEKTIDRLGLDVVHDMGCGYACDIFQPHGGSRRAAFQQNLLLQSRWQRPWKRWAERYLPRYREYDELMRRQYGREGTLFVALSRTVAGHFRELHGIPDSRIRLVPNGVDCERFHPRNQLTHRASFRARLGVGDREILLLIVAHNFRLKGVPQLLQAAARVVARGGPVRVAIVGGKRGSVDSVAVPKAVAGLVKFVGPVMDATPYYAAADVYAHPTFYDPCSLVVLEALASGLPVVTTRINGASELMTDGKEGRVLDKASNVDKLAEHLLELLDPRVRGRMAQAARVLAEAYPMDHNFRDIHALHRQVELRGRVAA